MSGYRVRAWLPVTRCGDAAVRRGCAMSARSRRSEGFCCCVAAWPRSAAGAASPPAAAPPGEPQQSPALACTVGGATKTLTWPMPTCPRWSRRLARFEAARAELERAADAGMAALRARRGPV